MPSERNRTSRLTTEGPGRANRAMLRAVGFLDDDFDRPMIGVASLFSDITPCNAHLDRLARKGCEGVRAGGGVPQIFGAPTASDGIMMGHQGMRYSLVSREVIADSLEVVAGGMNHDGLLAFGGCDKNMPGCVMAMARLNIPSIFVYGGSILPGIGPDGEDIDIVSHLRGGRPVPGRQARRQGRPQDRVRGLSRGRLVRRHVHGQHHEFGHRGDGHVAALRRQLPGRVGGQGARDVPGRQALVRLIEKNIRPRDIITRKSLENAYTLVLALGGSTNAVLHLMAIAREAEVEWTLADFDRLGAKVPHLADLKPGGRYVMNDLHRAGGTPAVLQGPARRRPAARRLHHRHRRRRWPRTSRTWKASIKRQQDVVRPLDRPMHATGHLVILHGNLAPEGAVAKVAGLNVPLSYAVRRQEHGRACHGAAAWTAVARHGNGAIPSDRLARRTGYPHDRHGAGGRFTRGRRPSAQRRNAPLHGRLRSKLERATRDVVSRAIYAEMRAGRTTPNGGVYIKMGHLGPANVAKLFKGMVDRCRDCGFDLAGGLVEVVPTAHYFMGGVICEVDTATECVGLFVAGEDASGMHDEPARRQWRRQFDGVRRHFRRCDAALDRQPSRFSRARRGGA